ncbi:MAG: hypothetical protein V1761_03000, partial [bacterium]
LTPVSIIKSGFAKTGVLTPDQETRKAMMTGSRFHSQLEIFDFANPEASLELLPPEWRRRIGAFLAHPELAGITTAQVYQELDFMTDTSASARRGTIDFLMIHNGQATIVDYKLKAIDDPAYAKQLEGYRDYVTAVTGLPVRTYLYSILEDRLLEIGGVSLD